MEYFERMKELRGERGETQAQVAAATGLQVRNYQRFELGENLPGYASLIALADHFEVTLDYLMCRTDER